LNGLSTYNAVDLTGIAHFTNIKALYFSSKSHQGIVHNGAFNPSNHPNLEILKIRFKTSTTNTPFVLNNMLFLEELNVFSTYNNTEITSFGLEVSGCPLLTTLDCNNNRLTSLAMSNLPSLTTLDCNNNQLTSLAMSNLPNLTTLNCIHNQLTSLDVSGLSSLTGLFCDNNQLTSLDVIGLPSLTSLLCKNNQLTSLAVSNLPNLTTLNCRHNQLTSLDVSGLPSLTSLLCQNNQLTVLNLKNGNNANFVNCNFGLYYPNNNSYNYGNYQLQCIQVDDVAYSEANWKYTHPTNSSYSYTWKPANAVYKTSCGAEFDPIGPFCAGTTAPQLPTNSLNGLTGTWSPATIDTATPGIKTYTFTKTSGGNYQTWNTTTIYVEVFEALEQPVFTNIDLPVVYCLNSTPFLLPTTSSNGIAGSWSPSVINTSVYGSQIYTFTPNNASLCLFPLEVEINVQQNNQMPPTGPPTQTFTEGQTLADLEVYYNNTNLLHWYGNATLTAWLPETTPLGNYATYYAVSTNGFCKSDPLTITVTQTASVTDFDLFGFSYYPNPVNDMLHFSSNQPIENVVVTNMLGQQINVSVSSDNKNLDMSNLPTGNYFVKVTIEGVSKTIKVVKR